MISTIGKYLDTLRVSLTFDFPDSLREVLQAAKDEARGSGDDLWDLGDPGVGIPGGRWYIRPSGRGKYQYVVENGAFWLAFSTWANMPALQLQFKASTLYEYEIEYYAALVDRVVRSFIGRDAVYEERVSRADLAVDFQMPDFVLPEISDVLTRAREWHYNGRGRRAHALTLGKYGGALQSQIYCKSEELLISDKAWMFDVWRATGNYREDLPVWRAEIRFMREGLRSFEIRTIDQLVDTLGDLARYAVGTESGTWLRVVDPSSRHLKDSSSRPAAGWWATLCEFFVSGLPGIGRKRKGYDPNPSLDRCIKLAGSMMARAAALHRLGYGSRTSLDPARFAEWIGWQYQKRLSMSGETWPDRVNRKTADLRAIAYA